MATPAAARLWAALRRLDATGGAQRACLVAEQATTDAALSVAESLVVTHDAALAVATALRPELLHVLGRVVEHRARGVSDGATAADDEAVTALCRVLSLAPHTAPLVARYMALAPFPLARAGEVGDPGTRRWLAHAALHLVHCAASTGDAQLRLLVTSHEVTSHALRLLACHDEHVRWAAIVILARGLHMAPAQVEALRRRCLTPQEEMDAELSWHDECTAVAVERAGWLLADDDSVAVAVDDVDASATPVPGYVHVCGVHIKCRTHTAACPPPSPEQLPRLVVTPSVQANMDTFAHALCGGRPILLEGPPGCGKSSMLRYFASLTGQHDMATLHLDHAADSKSLLGAYVCGDTPGEFRWQPGALAQAVTQGRWVLLEDVDAAPSEVITALVPLMEGRPLPVPGRGEALSPAPGFMLFGSVTTRPGVHRDLACPGLWTRVHVAPPPEGELGAILGGVLTHPGGQHLVQPLLSSLATTRALCGQASGSAPGGRAQVSLGGRELTLRDLIKWGHRMRSLHAAASLPLPDDSLAVPARELAVLEGADLLAGMVPPGPGRDSILAKLAEAWGVSADRALHYDSLHRPATSSADALLRIGRVSLQVHQAAPPPLASSGGYALTSHACRQLERLAAAVGCCEPVLLVGETGAGKTAAVQALARAVGARLTVVNMSTQSDSADLLGGFKPQDPSALCLPLATRFTELFGQTFPKEANAEFAARVAKYIERRNWPRLLQALALAAQRVDALTQAAQEDGDDGAARDAKRRRVVSPDLLHGWRELHSHTESVQRHLARASGTTDGGAHAQVVAAPVFAFVEGALVTALREGHWLLLDEINLAPVETLERLASIIEGPEGSVVLAERGDTAPVARHPSFRLFGAMNPANDAGKRDLPASVRSRFTELYMGETTTREDLSAIVTSSLAGVPRAPVDDIVDFFLAARTEAETRLLDSAGQKPQFSLRTLCRAMEYARAAMPVYGVQRALFDGLSMTFLTLLSDTTAPYVEALLTVHILKGLRPGELSRTPPAPPSAGASHVLFEQYWVEVGPGQLPEADARDDFVVTPSMRRHLATLARAVLLRRHPILLQGPTSSGKTSLVEYLARRTGHTFVRLNNHEHTDIAEYIGTYVAGRDGGITFVEGALVTAVRKGHWIVLDELNLAPSDVLEALNRLLDDNRELYIPELQQTIKPHPHFMLFATQNPPGTYGGRKVLSRAFRNRFLELHVGDIPDEELTTILQYRCQIPPSYCARLVEVMRELQRRRQTSAVFAGKDGFITARDLLRWGNRRANGYQALAVDGYLILAERLRTPEERAVVRSVLERVMRVTLDMDAVYAADAASAQAVLQQRLSEDTPHEFASAARFISWTPSLQRLYCLVSRCVAAGEPVLLIGETGAGKTTVCQLLSLLQRQPLSILNCHAYTETADFLGGYRPTPAAQRSAGAPAFEWMDGPLLSTMRQGAMFLVDELSLAEDGVLERLNSALEPSRTITLAERAGGPAGSADVETITAAPGWRLLATMNPGGDFGKRELSPALRNRFTEVWVPSAMQREDLLHLITPRLNGHAALQPVGDALVDFWCFFHGSRVATGTAARSSLTVRDVIAWAEFCVTATVSGALSPWEAYAHGAFLTLLDGLGLGMGMADTEAAELRRACTDFVRAQLPAAARGALDAAAFVELPPGLGLIADTTSLDGTLFGVAPFFISKGPHPVRRSAFSLHAPSTARNIMRLLRALSLAKPVLLEGSPGVGKTSLVGALAAASGHALVRINLSEQSDMMDLLGADLPAAGGAAGDFAWADGPLLAAVRSGAWVLLDELNLAPQAVLEGLNALLDHRREVYVPELDTVFRCPPTFRVFAAQNPLREGGGRKGLPRSFLNRFTRVAVESMGTADLEAVCAALHPAVPASCRVSMVAFNEALARAVVVDRTFGRSGSPWEFNLRDVLRWCQLAEHAAQGDAGGCFEAGAHDAAVVDAVAAMFSVVYMHRFRTHDDRQAAAALFAQHFPHTALDSLQQQPHVRLSPDAAYIGHARLRRSTARGSDCGLDCVLLRSQVPVLEASAAALEQGWMLALVGPSAAGKTSVARILAGLAGAKLHEVMLTSATDTADLLGSFEQLEPRRASADALRQLGDAAHTVVLGAVTAGHFGEAAEAFAAWAQYQRYMSGTQGAEQADAATVVACVSQAASLVGDSAAAAWQAAVDTHAASCRRDSDDLAVSGGSFHWVDGILLTAMESGDWVFLDNANMCSPTVLDRLNPVLEPSGVLLVPEAGTVDGASRCVTPQPGFRLILGLDPRHGEASRAMRNRGIEVFVPPCASEDEAAPDDKAQQLVGQYSDAVAVLSGHHLPGHALPRAMAAAAAALGGADKHRVAVWPTLRELCTAADVVRDLLQRGWSLPAATTSAWRQTYVLAASAHGIDPETALAAYYSHIAPAVAFAGQEQQPLVQPLSWPVPFTVADLIWGSPVSVQRRSGAVLCVAAAQAFAAEVAGQWNGTAAAAVRNSTAASLLPIALWRQSEAVTAVGGDAERQALNMLRVAGAVFVQQSVGDTSPPWLRALSSRMLAGTATTRASACVEDASAVAAALAHHPVASVLAAVSRRAAAVRFAPPGESTALPRDPDAHISSEEQALVAPHCVDERRATCVAVLAADALLAASHAAAHSSVMLASVQRSAVSTSASSQLGLCLARALSPELRVRQLAPHACVDMVPPVLHAVAALEAAALHQLCSYLSDAADGALPAAVGAVCEQVMHGVTLVSGLAEWRDRMVALLCGTDALPIDALLIAWLRLRKFMARVVALVSASSADVCAAARHATAAMDSTWGISALDAPKPLLWRQAGHPTMPTPGLAHLEAALRSLCETPALPYDPQLRVSLAQAACFFTGSHVGADPSKQAPALGVADAQMLLTGAQQKAAGLQAAPVEGAAPDAAVASAAAATCDAANACGGLELAFPPELDQWAGTAPLAAQLRGTATVASLRATHALVTALSAMPAGPEAQALISGAAGPGVAADRLLAFTLHASDRRVLDVAPLQQLAWLAELAQADELGNVLPDAVHELWFRFHTALGRMQSTDALGSPLALFRPVITARLADLAATASKASISERAATILQLRLAVRSLRGGASLGVAPGTQLGMRAASSDAQAVVTLTVQLLRACAPRWPVCEQLAAMVTAQPRAAATMLADAGTRDGFTAADLVAPLLTAVAAVREQTDGALAAPAGEADRGAAWAMLGCVRLSLLVAELLADPVARDAFKLGHLRARRDDDLGPELLVRSAAAALPGAPSDSRARGRAEATIISLTESIVRLEARAVPRPADGQWMPIHAEMSRFTAGLGSMARVSALLKSLRRGTAAAVAEAVTWQSTASQLVESMAARHGAYRDAVQPMLLAVSEMKYGLALCEAAAAAEQGRAHQLLPALLSFPAPPQALAALTAPDSADEAALALSDGRASRSKAVDAARLEVLRLALRVLHSHAGWSAATWTHHCDLVQRIVAVWTAARAAQTEAEAEALAEFRIATRSPAAAAVEAAAANEEAYYRARFAAGIDPFADLEAPRDEIAPMEVNDAPKPPEVAAPGPAAGASTVFDAATVADVVSAHWSCVASAVPMPKPLRPLAEADAPAGAAPPEDAAASDLATHFDPHDSGVIASALRGARERFSAPEMGAVACTVSAHSLGARLLTAAGSRRGDGISDDDTAGGSALRLSVEYLRLSQSAHRVSASDDAAAADDAAYALSHGGWPAEMSELQAPVLAVRSRLRELLAEWPEHPVLEQLDAICGRVLGLPANGPLKAALTGIELLLARSQPWEEGAANHVSLASLLAPCARLAQRWRALELAAWPRALVASARQAAASANNTWFPLFRLLTAQPPAEEAACRTWIRGVAAAIEEYVISSPLGEFERRLALLWSFYALMRVDDASQRGGAPHSRAASVQLAALLFNTHRYYAQFAPSVRAALAAACAPVAAKLREHVKLARWEDRGYHALRASSDRNARVLHRLLHTWETELAKPTAPIFAAAADKVGRPPPVQASPVAKGDDAQLAVDAAEGGSAAAEWDAAGWAAHVGDMQAAAGRNAAALSRLGVTPSAVSAVSSVARVDALCSRLSTVLSSALADGQQQRNACAADLDDIVAAVVTRAAALRADAKATKPMKKKALTDLLRGLNDTGVSLRRSTVPPDEREPVTWFAAHPEVAVPASIVPSEAALDAWTAAEALYFRNVARVKAMWQINNGIFHADISAREADAAKHSVEHLLHLQRTQRGVLRAYVDASGQLHHAAALSAALGSAASPLPCTSSTREWMWRAHGGLDAACRTAFDVVILLKALRCVETSPHHVGCVPAALAAAQAASTALSAAKGVLETHVRSGNAVFADKLSEPVLATPQMAADLAAALAAGPAQLAALHAAVPDAGDLPGWRELCAVVASVADLHDTYATQAGAASAGDAQHRDASNAVSLAGGIVEEVLLWAQRMHSATPPAVAAEAADDAHEGSPSNLVKDTATLEATLAPERLRRIADSVRALAAEVAGLTAGGPSTQQDAAVAAASLAALHPLLQLVLRASELVVADYIRLHKATAKLCGVLISMFATLSRDGYCTPPEQREAPGDGAGDGKLLDDQAGTGIGEGEGKKDISDEIEDEAQILGMEDLKKEEGAPEPPVGGDDKGIEMAGDFEGEMHDLEHDPEEEGDQPPETEADQLDKEMGEAGANAEVIDEKLWGDDDKDQDGKDGPDGAPEQEKYERGGAVKVGPQQELEYRGADEAEGGAPEDKPDDVADDKEKEPQAQPQRPDTVAAEDGGAQVNEMENEVEEGTGLQPRGPEGQGDGDDDGVDAEGEADVDGAEEEGGADAEAGAAEEEVPGADADAADDMELEGGQDGEEDAGGDDGRGDVADMEADDDAAAAGEEEHPPDEPGGERTAPDTDAAPGAEEPQDASAGQRGGAGAPQSDDKQRGGTASGRGTFPTQAAPVAPDGPADVDDGGDQGDDFDVEGSDADAGDAADAGAGGAAGSGAGAGAGAGGTQGAVARGGQASRRGPPPPRTRTEPNPYRNLGDALQKWRERLSVVGDAPAQPQPGPVDSDMPAADGEFEFLGADEEDAPGGKGDGQGGSGGMQTLADATEEQAAASAHAARQQQEQQDVEPTAAAMEEDTPDDGQHTADGVAADDVAEAQPAGGGDAAQRTAPPRRRDAAAKREEGPHTADVSPNQPQETPGAEDTDMDAGAAAAAAAAYGRALEPATGDGSNTAVVSLHLQRTRLDDAEEADALPSVPVLTDDQVAALRGEAEEALAAWQGASQLGLQDGELAARAGALWTRFESLTAPLASELCEQLRLILEPTLAAKLQGDYRTGKRLNMRKIIPYLASEFRRDKIWLRRSKPSVRKYQVVLALDDSRSMAENRCGALALEALTCIARAMSRLEVGELGVLSFGTSGERGVRILHPLGAPFTDAAGPGLVSSFTFAGEHTVADAPVGALLDTLDVQLTAARESHSGGNEQLQQLVLIIADGHFHEKESLRLRMRRLERQGLLVAFIALDPTQALLNMQSVSFTSGRPVFTAYLESFPFPFFTIVGEVSTLPRTLCGLLRQWFELIRD